jgi:ferrochelatase
LPLYPQFSSSTSKSSIEQFLNEISFKLDEKLNVKVICCYPDQPDFIRSHSILIKQTIARFYENNLEKFRFLFSAHGLPQKLIDAGDPYVFHVEKTTSAIVRNLAEIFSASENKIDFKICYQSKVGPLRWTQPSLEYELRRAALDKKFVVVIPVSFVSDHSETLVELDIDYKNLAKILGIENYLRVPALNLEGHFIKSLTEICKNASAKNEEIFSGTKAERICPKNFKFCPNPC